MTMHYKEASMLQILSSEPAEGKLQGRHSFSVSDTKAVKIWPGVNHLILL